MAKKRIINAPSKDILDMLKKRMPSDARTSLNEHHVAAIGLIMVSIPDLYFYADIISKSANVVVSEIFGSCPQHVTTLAVFGEIAAIKIAMQIIDISILTARILIWRKIHQCKRLKIRRCKLSPA